MKINEEVSLKVLVKHIPEINLKSYKLFEKTTRILKSQKDNINVYFLALEKLDNEASSKALVLSLKEKRITVKRMKINFILSHLYSFLKCKDQKLLDFNSLSDYNRFKEILNQEKNSSLKKIVSNK